ncbi:MAG TPA: hypothetical protein VMX18_00635 [Candidatus Bipolaricaulota bacterium]|nr:hypothetical protein [Candidatus Bipolaricaulota bacterium]
MAKKILFYVAVCGLLLSPAFGVAKAAEFDPGLIISDFELFNDSAMDEKNVRLFLMSQPGKLKDMIFEDIDGEVKDAAQIIYLAAKRYGVNPKYLMVVLQKEQSLLEDPDPSENQLAWATGYAVCDSCSKDDPAIQKFKGFAKQVDCAAGAMKYYTENSHKFLFQKGGTYQIDDEDVTIYNQATANLYIYTPHLHGNYNFWKLWNRYFIQKYPDGSIVRADGEKGVWLIRNGEKKPFDSWGALVSRYNPENILIVDKNSLSQYPAGAVIKYAQYSLLSDPDGTIYLLSDDKLRKVESKDVFKTIGFNLEEIIEITKAEAESYPAGEPITMNTAYPAGALLQDNQTGGVYFVQNGIKYPIINKYLLEINYAGQSLRQVTSDELAKYTRGEPISMRDGALIKSYDAPNVYVISNGKKCLIDNEQVFDAIGYKWTNIKVIDPSTIVNIENGAEITLNYTETE